MPFLWAPMIAKLLKIFFPYEKKVENSTDGASSLLQNDLNNVKNHEKVN